MRILLKLLYFLLFLLLAFAAMFLGGVSGVAGSFYLMVKEGTIEDNLMIGITALLVSLVIVWILRGQNKKVMRQRQALEQELSTDDEQ